MLSLFLLLAAIDCVDPKTPQGLREIDNGASACRKPDRPITPTERLRMVRAFDRILKDGPSTRWRVETVRADFLVCGYLNSKNSFGAYSGWTAFMFDLNSGDASTYQDDKLWLFETLCHGAPVPKP